MTSPFRFKYPFPPQAQPSTPSTPSSQLSARNFILPSRPWNTPTSSVPSGVATASDDIDDPPSDEEDIPRKRTRYSSVHDFASDNEDEDRFAPPSSVPDTPVVKRPPVILPQPSPDSAPIEFSPSRRQPYQPNGLVAHAARLIHEHSAVSSVAVPRLDQDDTVIVTEIKPADGAGTICRVDMSLGSRVILLVASKGLSASKQVEVGDCLSISNAIKLDKIWICSSWHHKPV